MVRVIIGSAVGSLFGALVATFAALGLLGLAPSLGGAGVMLLAIWFGGQWAVVGGLVGATSAVVDAIRQRDQAARPAGPRYGAPPDADEGNPLPPPPRER